VLLLVLLVLLLVLLVLLVLLLITAGESVLLLTWCVDSGVGSALKGNAA
jgi:hypothetical protein